MEGLSLAFVYIFAASAMPVLFPACLLQGSDSSRIQ